MSKLDELGLLISQENYDLIALTEIKPKNGNIPSSNCMHIPGYEQYTSDLTAPDTRGVCLYVKQSLTSNLVEPPKPIVYKDSIWVTITGKGNTKLLAGCVYRSGSSSIAIPRDETLHELLKWAASDGSHSHRLIAGDFNHPLITWDPSPILPENIAPENPATKFATCIADTFLHQHITEPTRYRGNQTPTNDDLIFSNEQELVQQLQLLSPLGGSDHIGISMNFLFDYRTDTHKQVSFNWNKADFEGMRETLDKDWESLLQDKSTQEAFSILSTNIQEAVDKHVPKREIDPGEKRFKPLWMNSAALRRVKKKYHAWLRYLNTKSGQDYQRYITERNSSAQESRKSRREFEQMLAKECKLNNKGFWRYVNSSRKVRTKIGDLKNEAGGFATEDTDKAEVLSEQYYKTFTVEDTDNLPSTTEKRLHTERLHHITLTQKEVKEKLLSLRIDKSPGPDGIHPRLLKEMAEVLCGPVTTIFNRSLSDAELPQDWKDAVIAPIFKKGSKSDPANYRPVSLTSILCKLLERCIAERITQHIKDNDLTCQEQHGFQTGRSTTTNLLEALNIWTEALSHNIPVDVIFLDYAKAFDTVPHRRLLNKVKALGIDGNILGWIEQFLTGRRQCVKVNTSTSAWKPVISGVPQGTVLGPLLFTIFVSDMPDQVSNFISLFADDTKIYAYLLEDEDGQVSSNLQDDITNLQEWANKMQMRFHPDKCKCMHLGKHNPHHTYRMTTPDGKIHNITATSKEKDLGVLIDDELSFAAHIQAQVNKANSVLGSIKNTFKYIDINSFNLLYKSLVRPHLEYATVVWAPHTKFLKDAIERVQRRATRLVHGLSDLPYSERLRKLGLPTLQYRRLRTDQIQMFKLVHNIDTLDTSKPCPKCGNSMIRPSLAVNTRGHKFKLQVQGTTGVRRHFFSTRALHDWNNFNEETVTSPNVNIFKNRLGKEWRNHPELYDYVFSY